MKILVLNPNTSDLVTERVAGVIRSIARPDIQVEVAHIAHGPEALESYYDESVAAPYIISEIKRANQDGYAAVLIAAFCDPVLEAAKEISSIPVFGMEETAFSVALLMGNKFGILTEKRSKEAVKRQHVRKHGLTERFAGVRALDMGVVEIAQDPGAVKRKGIEICRRLVQEDGAEVIILGCASMAGYNAEIEASVGVPVIDPVAVAYKVIEGIAELGICHSKVGLYATPAPKKIS